MKIAIIPARGGSKRILRKNVKGFLGKPLISYSISAALESNCFDKVVVSTDDEEIGEIASTYGAEVPYIRRSEIANDFTPVKDVMRDVINWYMRKNVNLQYICCIYATAPLIKVMDIRSGFEMLESSPEANFAISVTAFSYPIQRSLRIKEDGLLAMNNPEHALTRSQDLETMYHDAAQFFWARASSMMKYDAIFDSNCCPIVVPSYRVQDIDNEDDWIDAELKYKMLKKMDAGIGAMDD